MNTTSRSYRLPLWAYVALGGGLGSLLRAIIGGICSDYWHFSSWWALAVVNLSGACLLGMIATWCGGEHHDAVVCRSFWGIGVCGGYTTYSAVILETLPLFDSNRYWEAALSVMTLVVAGTIAVAAGSAIAHAIRRKMS